MARFLGIDVYWGEPPGGHRSHGPIRESTPAEERIAKRHHKRSGCNCQLLCQHDGFWGTSYYCDGCGKGVS